MDVHMDCQHVREKIALWMDGALANEEAAAVGQHFTGCKSCRDELKAYTKAWNALKSWPDLEPNPGYVSRFWTRLSRQEPWYVRIWKFWKPILTDRFFAPGLATALLVIITASIIFYNTFSATQTETLISSLTADDIEFVENIEIAENYDVIQNIDLLEDLDVIENMPSLKS